MQTENKTKNSNSTWMYLLSFSFVFILLAIGVALEYIYKGKGQLLPSLPYNFYILFIFCSSVIFFYFRFRNHSVITWLSSIPAAISAIFGYIICLFCIGYFPQTIHTNELFQLVGLTHIKNSFPFLIINLYLLTCLGFNILNKLHPLKIKSIWFFLNHFGLFLIIISTGLGYGDLKRVNINLLETGEQSNIGIANNGDMYQLPFSLKLINVTLEEYPPKLAIIDSTLNNHAIFEEANIQKTISKGSYYILPGWYISILDYMPNAFFQDSIYSNSDILGSCPTAYVEVFNLKQKNHFKGWISSGSFNQNQKLLQLEPNHLLTLTYPKPKKLISKLVLLKDSLPSDTLLLEINKPIKVGGWRLYQLSYDKSKGKWSTLSVIEAVSDPWQKFTIIGICFLILGMVYLLFGKNKPNMPL